MDNYKIGALNGEMMENLETETARRRRAECINRVLFQISSSLNTTTNQHELYGIIHHSLSSIIDTTNFFIALYHKETDSITFPYYIDEVDDVYSHVIAVTGTASLTAEVIRTGAPVMVTKDCALRNRLKSAQKIPRSTPSEIWLGVPLKNQNQIIGVMVVQSYTDPNLYDKTDMDVMLSVADQAAVVIESKRSEIELQKSHERYRALSDATFEAVFITENGICLDTNRTAEAMFGYTYDELNGIFGTDIFAPESKNRVTENMLSGYQEPYEAMGQKKDGTVFDVEIRGRNIDYKGKNVRVTVVRDISEQKKAEKQKQVLEEKLRHSHKMEAIGTLAGGVASNFNNILGIILGNAELALDDIPKWNSARSHLEEIRVAILQAKDIARQLLGFSQTPDLKQKPVRLRDILEDTVTLLKASTPKTTQLVLSVSDDPCVIDANQAEISQVLINLCTNAVHAMDDEQGTVEIKLDRIYYTPTEEPENPGMLPGKYAEITVLDTGHGIDPEISDKIFDPYFTTHKFGKCMGMGLAVVHGIVKGHNGQISIQNRQKKGTRVKVHFPLLET